VTRWLLLKYQIFGESIEMVVFPNSLESYRLILEEGALIVCRGKISKRNGDVSIIFEQGKKLETKNN